METPSSSYKIRLGIFIASGLTIFSLAIFIIGKQKNLFNSVITIKANFQNVSGLEVGNNVRFSGITIGTVDKIAIINDSTVQVDLLIKNEVQAFIKKDSEVGIGSSGIIGDRLVIISQGGTNSPNIENWDELVSNEPVETDAIMGSLNLASFNAAIVSEQLAEILIKVNHGNGTLGQLIQDSTFARNLEQAIINLGNSSRDLNENMEAAKHNFFLKSFFDKQKKEAKKK